MGPLEILCGIAVTILLLYYYLTSNFNFWKARGVAGPRPIPIFGNFKDVMLTKKSMSEYFKELYDDFKNEPMIGIFVRRSPVLVLRDPEFIKDVLIKDFSKFADRGFTNHDKGDPLSQHLFALQPKRWRPLRVKLSPVFTSGKLKEMFTIISKCSDHLEQYLEKITNEEEVVECRELTAKYTTDVIGTCAFGIETNALADENSEFRRMGRQVFDPNWFSILRIRLRQSTPWLFDILSNILPHTKVTKFFIRTVMENINYREKNNIVRHDFIDMLRELKKHPDKVDNIEMTDSLIAAQAFVFFIAGFETSATTMSNALYELALNSKVQDKLREEINQEYARNVGDLTYETIKEMKYLDKVFKETLRKYPPGTVLLRQSVEDYTFEGTTVNIPKDLRVWIPIYAIQRDPNIYPKPDVFDPERFTEEMVKTRHPMNYLPFGDGPRNCIGARFAIFQTKIGLIKLIRNFKFEPSEKTQIPYVIDPKAFLLAPKHGIHLKLTKIDPA